MMMISMTTTTSKAATIDFELVDMNNQARPTYKSADHKNAVFVLEFYQYNCGPCQSNAVNIHKLYDEYKDYLRVQILDVGIDPSDSLYQQWIARQSPKYPVLNDGRRSLSRKISLEATPTTLVVDCNMNEIHRIVGTWEAADAAKVRELIEQQLQVVCQ